MKLSNTFFTSNRRALREKLNLTSDELIVVTGDVLMQYHADQAANFLQNSNFFYLTGINEPDCLLVVGYDDEYLLIPDNDDFESLWNGQITAKEASAISGVKNIYGYSEGWDKISASRKNNLKVIYSIKQLPEFIYGNVFTNPAQRILDKKLKKTFPKIQIKPINQTVAELRVVKQKPEIDSINQAIKLTTKAFENVFAKISDSLNESEIDASIAYDFMRAGSQEAYRSIVASGSRACTIHYESNDHALEKSDLLLIDAGARVNNYAADITRTFPINGKTSSRQAEIIAAVADVHKFALGIIKPGVKFVEYEQLVTDEMGVHLKQLGLINDPKDQEQVRKYFPHATSHFLGLDVHDVGARADTELQAGMVMTVEPGIYIPEESIGVRLEDDVLVTASGADNLSQDLSFSAKI